MNLEEIFKYDQLKFETDKTETSDKRTFPHIISKDSFEKLIMNVEDQQTTKTTTNRIQNQQSTKTTTNRIQNQQSNDSNFFSSKISPAQNASITDEYSTANSHIITTAKETSSQSSQANKDISPQRFQQTSVITSNTSVRNEPKKRSMQRQRNIDESFVIGSAKESDNNNNNNNNNNKNNSNNRRTLSLEKNHMSIDKTDRIMSFDTAERTHTSSFDGAERTHTSSFDSAERTHLSNVHDKLSYRPYSMIPYSSFDEDFKHAPPGMLKSKSLDNPDHQHQIMERDPNFPKKHNSFQYEEETARVYLKSLNINPHYPHGGSSIHGSARSSPHGGLSRDNSLTRDGNLSRDSSFSDSPTSTSNNSPMGNMSPLRRLQELEQNKTNQLNFTQSRHINLAQANSKRPMIFSRSYEQQQPIHHKYTQRKAYSVNSAPYDVLNRETNLRRIFSEEIVPEQPTFNKEKRTHVQQSMRRAASYDLASYVRHSKINREKLSGSVGNFHQQTTGKPATKILFPQHDNVNDYKNIFLTQIDDEASHARNVMEKSNLFNNSNNNNIDFVNYFNNSVKNYPFQDEAKKNTSDTKNKVKSQTSQDNNLVIGPYKYEASTDDEVAVCVTGLLTLPGSNEKRYSISVGELRRRIAPPEYLNKVDMISYVRLAKTSARELLEKHAIRPKHHSRKSRHSVISKMCEAECTELATGIKTLSEAYFPKEFIAKESIASLMNQNDDQTKKKKLCEQREKLKTTRSVLQELATLLRENESSEQMQNYNLATHSYGLQSLTNNITLMSALLESQSNEINTTMCAIGGLTNNTNTDNVAMETDESLNNNDTLKTL